MVKHESSTFKKTAQLKIYSVAFSRRITEDKIFCDGDWKSRVWHNLSNASRFRVSWWSGTS